MTDIQAAELLAILFSMYPVETRNIPALQADLMMRGYARALGDLEYGILSMALDQLLKTSERLPTAARIRKACMELQRGPRRPGGEAWGDVVRQMKRSGYTRTPNVDFTFEDPLVDRAVHALGWQELCKSEGSAAHASDRARFIELYDSLECNEREEAQVSTGARLPARERRQLAASEAVGRVLARVEVPHPPKWWSARSGLDDCDGEHPAPSCKSDRCWVFTGTRP